MIQTYAFAGLSVKVTFVQDHYDVKMPCHLLLSKLAVKAGGNVLAALDSLSKPLEKTLTVRLKTDAVKQEVRDNVLHAFHLSVLTSESLQVRERLILLLFLSGQEIIFTIPM